MAERNKILAEDLSLLEFLMEKGGTIGSLVAATSLDKELVKRRMKVLRRLGLITTKPEAMRTYVLTTLGSRLADTKDVHLVEPYSITDVVPPDLGFKFAVGEGLYTGDIALSYRELAQLIGKIDARSLTFHLYRGDFARWVTHIFGNEGRRTALKLKKLASRTMPPDHLRSRLVRIFSAELMVVEQT